MRILSSFSAVQDFKNASPNVPLVFVPTMGALHSGHLSLVQKAKTMGGKTLVSIFVNPTQFTNAEDLEKYPRDTAGDIKKLEGEGVDAVFLPSREEVYPNTPPNLPREIGTGSSKGRKILLPPLFKTLEGAARAGHFEGVFEVLFRFFSSISPDHVIFGQKDYQQTLLVKHLCKTHFPNICIHIAPIFREENGLAMSSRNERLLKKDRADAKILFETLQMVVRRIQSGEKNVKKLLEEGIEELFLDKRISAVHYLTLADPETLEPKSEPKKGDILLLSVTYAGIHLIDNLIV